LPVQTPNSLISGIHAVIVGDTIPAEMVHSQSYPVSLHLLNDGSDDWITQHMVGVTALEEAANFGPKWMPVPISGPVASGKIQTVEFTIRAPSNPGTYTLKYQAAREGSGVEVIYGRAYTRTITVR
jgi:hypothetical protein